jgi:hypothetical protein
MRRLGHRGRGRYRNRGRYPVCLIDTDTDTDTDPDADKILFPCPQHSRLNLFEPYLNQRRQARLNLFDPLNPLFPHTLSFPVPSISPIEPAPSGAFEPYLNP